MQIVAATLATLAIPVGLILLILGTTGKYTVEVRAILVTTGIGLIVASVLVLRKVRKDKLAIVADILFPW